VEGERRRLGGPTMFGFIAKWGRTVSYRGAKCAGRRGILKGQKLQKKDNGDKDAGTDSILKHYARPQSELLR